MIVSACLAFVAAVMAVALGGVVWYRDEPSAARNSLIGALSLLGIDSCFIGLSCCGTSADSVIFWQSLRFVPFALVPGTWLFFALTYSRGAPRESLRRWRYVQPVILGLPLVVVIMGFPMLVSGLAAGEDGTSLMVALGRPARALHAASMLTSVLVLMNLERTLRAATGTMRWRIKYMIVGTGLLLCVRIYTSTQVVLYSGLEMSQYGLESAGLILCQLLILRALLRARLLHVDVYPSHAVLYYSVTVIVTGVYLVTVGLLAEVAARMGVTEGYPVKAFVLLLALIGLTILILSDRVKLGIRRFVGRHFERPQYDYREVWQAFAAQSARAMEPEPLCRSFAGMLSQSFDVLGVTIWLVDDAGQQLSLGGSTTLVETQAEDILTREADHAALVAAIGVLSPVVDIDADDSDANCKLRCLAPVEFGRKGGHRLCAPLCSGQELLGLVVFSDRVRGVPFTTEEMDLIVTIGQELSANLLKIRLSAEVFAAKQLEAFQAMSAFIIHDLKNTSSTLSLTLGNLPRHFDNPAFREDALAAISKSVNHVNELIGRLRVLRSGLVIEPGETDLNRIAKDAVEALDPARRAPVEVATEAAGSAWCDGRQIQGVVTNLLLNALDAGGDDGHVWLTTRAEGKWVHLSVRDDGVGIGREFIERSLFRPFQSTKKNGMGIGLFHSKTIVEAHGGRIDVRSSPGEGSTFSIVLRTKEGT